jgi:hypothetical protein
MIPGDERLRLARSHMKPPICRNCGVASWGHTCLSSIDEIAARTPVVKASAIAPILEGKALAKPTPLKKGRTAKKPVAGRARVGAAP